MDEAGRLLADERRLLTVPAGQRGLQPSAAVWQHTVNLPELMERALGPEHPPVAAIAASVTPRPAAGSYLPVFRVGEGHARSLAAALRVPFFPTTHQEGHISAGLFSSQADLGERFLAIHLSGGTTELLQVQRQGPGFAEELIGATTDLHAGQFVDRVGVALGQPFPAGPHLERLAAEGIPGAVTLPASVSGLRVSFSGVGTRATRLVGQARPADLALAVFHCLAKTLEKWLLAARDATGLREALVVGGVAANGILRHRLSGRLEHPAVGMRIAYAQPRFSTDNAVGVALIGRAASSPPL